MVVGVYMQDGIMMVCVSFFCVRVVCVVYAKPVIGNMCGLNCASSGCMLCMIKV
jgi:hypothetical protein